jgi:branched-subunit amino acid aminotransferase/4-amino-4-deoxychorismate lyase
VEGPRCYTTGRFAPGRVRHGVRVVARWVRDARALGLGEIDPEQAHAALLALGRRAFGEGEGIVRLEARTGPEGLLWLGLPRPIGEEPARWRAGASAVVHPGPGPVLGAKRPDLDFIPEAKEEARRAGWDEALLVDAAGWVVEGARSSLVAVLENGDLVTPPLALGGVASVSRAVLVDCVPELGDREISWPELRGARELIAINAVRGARPIVRLDGEPVADGGAGPWSARLGLVLDEAP